jgi:hypothetical protein
MGDLVLDAINAAYVEGRLPDSFSLGLITLLHKKGPHADLDNYRPITLLNADYKILATMLVARIAPLLDKLVPDSQTAFLPNRWIGDNILYHLEAIDYIQETETPAAMIFIDYAKAYDRVDYEWLFRCGKALGLPAAFLKWVFIIYSDPRCEVMVNGWGTGSFKIAAGMRQGDPLSSLLYIISILPLETHIQHQVDQKIISVPRTPSLKLQPMMMHADVTVFVLDPDSIIPVMRDAIPLHEKASGAAVQPTKTNVLVFNAELDPPVEDMEGPLDGNSPGQQSNTPRTICGLPVTTGSLRHLGVQLGHPQAKDRLAQATLDGIIRAAHRWSRHRLSLIGRVYVAKSELASKLVHILSFCMIPPDILALAIRTVRARVHR